MAAPQKRGRLTHSFPRSECGVRTTELIPSLPKTYEGTVTAANSPVVLSFYSDMGYNAIQGWITCDGPVGDLLFSFSRDGTTYGDTHTMKPGENINLKGFDVHSIKLEHSGTDSAYRIFQI